MKFFKWFAGLFKRNPKCVRVEISLGPIKRHLRIAPKAFDEFMKRPEDKRCVTIGFPGREASANIISGDGAEASFAKNGVGIAGHVVRVCGSQGDCIDIALHNTPEGRAAQELILKGAGKMAYGLSGIGQMMPDNQMELEGIYFASIVPADYGD